MGLPLGITGREWNKGETGGRSPKTKNGFIVPGCRDRARISGRSPALVERTDCDTHRRFSPY